MTRSRAVIPLLLALALPTGANAGEEGGHHSPFEGMPLLMLIEYAPSFRSCSRSRCRQAPTPARKAAITRRSKGCPCSC